MTPDNGMVLDGYMETTQIPTTAHRTTIGAKTFVIVLDQNGEEYSRMGGARAERAQFVEVCTAGPSRDDAGHVWVEGLRAKRPNHRHVTARRVQGYHFTGVDHFVSSIPVEG